MDEKNLARILWPTMWLGFLFGGMTSVIVISLTIGESGLVEPMWWAVVLIAAPIITVALLFVPLSRWLARLVLSARGRDAS